MYSISETRRHGALAVSRAAGARHAEKADCGPVAGRLAGRIPAIPCLRDFLLALGAVLRPALLPARDPAGVQRAPHDVVAHAGKVLHAAPANENDRVLLQVEIGRAHV